jgi:hypothetical protein
MTSKIDLTGIPGGNPLGFLAAIGALSASTRALSSMPVKLAWISSDTGWTPRLLFTEEVSPATLVERIHEELAALGQAEALAIADDLSIAHETFRESADSAARAGSPDDRISVDYLCAFGSDAVQAKSGGKPTGMIADTAFRTMSGSGHQHFLGSMRTFAKDTTPDHLRRALFESWRYDDPVEKHTMRWDPVDDVRYALRWRNPSGDPVRKAGGSVWGANLLAIEGLRLFPTAPFRDSLRTTGFTQWRSRGTYWTWPIWCSPIGLDAVRSLVALKELQREKPDRQSLRKLGIAEVYRSQRIAQGKFRNFSHAIPV